MRKQIVGFLREARTGNKSDKAVRKMVADNFGGEIVGQYVKVSGVEYLIQRNPDCLDCGFSVKEMNWKHGNDWRFSSPY